MRKIVSLAAGFILLGLSSTPVFSQNDKEKEKDQTRIEGSGNVVTKDVSVQPFDQLEASGVFNVSLKQGDRESVKIEAEDNLQPLFEVKNDGSKLIVGMKKDSHFNSKKKMTVYITFKSLKSMDLKMVGNVASDGSLSFGNLSMNNKSVGSIDLSLDAQKLNIKNESVGNLKLSGKAENAVIRSKSVGSIRAADFLVQTMDIDNDGIGSAEVNAAKQISVKDSFLGKVKNVGSANIRKKVVI